MSNIDEAYAVLNIIYKDVRVINKKYNMCMCQGYNGYYSLIKDNEDISLNPKIVSFSTGKTWITYITEDNNLFVVNQKTGNVIYHENNNYDFHVYAENSYSFIAITNKKYNRNLIVLSRRLYNDEPIMILNSIEALVQNTDSSIDIVKDNKRISANKLIQMRKFMN